MDHPSVIVLARLLAIADALDAAVRQGAHYADVSAILADVPEGSCYITISDTLARQWAALIRQVTQIQAIE